VGKRAAFMLLGLLLGLAAPAAAVAQDSWVFAESVPCDSAPVYGVPFNDCAVSNTRSFRVGNARAWRMLYTDPTSEAAVGLYRLIEAHGVGGMGPATQSMADWLRGADSLRSVTAGAFGWVQNDQFVAFHELHRKIQRDVEARAATPLPAGYADDVEKQLRGIIASMVPVSRRAWNDAKRDVLTEMGAELERLGMTSHGAST